MRPPGVPALPQTAPAGDASRQVVRSLLMELLGQERLTLPEAGQIEAALRRLDRAVVWDLLAMGQARPAAPPALQPPVARPAPALRDSAGGAPLDAAWLSLVFELCDGLTRSAGHDDAFVARLAPLRVLLAGRLTPERIESVRSRLGQLIEEQLDVQRACRRRAHRSRSRSPRSSSALPRWAHRPDTSASG